MGFIERRSGEGRYRARYRDPLGRQRSKTFGRKADAQRFLLEMESDKACGGWIDPRGAELPLAAWAEEFMLLCRRLAPTTQDTYRRDLDRFVLPRFGSYRLGRIPADEIENWLNDEIAVTSSVPGSPARAHLRRISVAARAAVPLWRSTGTARPAGHRVCRIPSRAVRSSGRSPRPRERVARGPLTGVPMKLSGPPTGRAWQVPEGEPANV